MESLEEDRESGDGGEGSRHGVVAVELSLLLEMGVAEVEAAVDAFVVAWIGPLT